METLSNAFELADSDLEDVTEVDEPEAPQWFDRAAVMTLCGRVAEEEPRAPMATPTPWIRATAPGVPVESWRRARGWTAED